MPNLFILNMLRTTQRPAVNINYTETLAILASGYMKLLIYTKEKKLSPIRF